MASVTEKIKYRNAVHCYLAYLEYGERFAKTARLKIDKVEELSKMDHNELFQAKLIYTTNMVESYNR